MILERDEDSVNNSPASGDFCRLLITFANSLDPDQARQNVGPVLDSYCLIMMAFLKRKQFKKKDNFKQKINK